MMSNEVFKMATKKTTTNDKGVEMENGMNLTNEVARKVWMNAQNSMEYKGVRKWVQACLELTDNGGDVNSTKIDFYTNVIPALAELCVKCDDFDSDSAHRTIEDVIDVQIMCGIVIKNNVDMDKMGEIGSNLKKCYCDMFDVIVAGISK